MSLTCVSQGTLTAQYPWGLVVPVGPLGGRIGGLSSRSFAGLSSTKQLSVEFVQTADLVSAASREPRVNRRGDAELIVVRGRHRPVVGNEEVLVRPAEVGDL